MGRQGNKIQLTVIGAGPAGAYAAYTAAGKGLDVLLVERSPVIGHAPCCAEAISHIGLTSFVEPDMKFIATPISAVQFTVATGYICRRDFDNPIGYVLDRKEFDPYLAEMAVQAGAGLLPDTAVVDIKIDDSGPARLTLEGPQGNYEIESDFVIAADGVESMIGRQAGLNTQVKLSQSETTLQYRVKGIEVLPHCLEFCVGQKYAPGSYLWVFPKSENSANIGLGLNPARHAGEELRPYLNRFLDKRYGRYEIEFETCGMVPKYLGLDIVGRDNLLLAGDAARTLDSLVGAGIAKAMHTGRMAAESVAETIDKRFTTDQMQKLYRQRIETEVGRDLSFTRKAYPVFRKFSDSDWETLVDFFAEYTKNKITGSISDPVNIVRSALRGAPQLLKLARHLF